MYDNSDIKKLITNYHPATA